MKCYKYKIKLECHLICCENHRKIRQECKLKECNKIIEPSPAPTLYVNTTNNQNNADDKGEKMRIIGKLNSNHDWTIDELGTKINELIETFNKHQEEIKEKIEYAITIRNYEKNMDEIIIKQQERIKQQELKLNQMCEKGE
jgi:hypothetical protein